MTRQQLQILLDEPDRTDYVVSAYADLTVKDGFRTYIDQQLRNEARAAEQVLEGTTARKVLDDNLETVRRAVNEERGPKTRGLAVFAGAARGLQHVVPLEFAVENRLVIDLEPYVLPLLERWYGEPSYLVAVADSHRAQFFESRAGAVSPLRGMEREDIDEPIERDKPRFNYKKRFAQTRHERLRGVDEDRFLHEVAEAIDAHWKDAGGRFTGLILLGQPPITAALGRLLPKDVQQAVVEHAPQSMTTKPDDLADEVARAMSRWHAERSRVLLDELSSRWKTRYRVADGPTDVLDALQQGRAAQIIFGKRRTLDGARCRSCGYRLGAPVRACPYCQGQCRPVDAAQEILRVAVRHRVPVHLLRRDDPSDPVDAAGGVSALLRAEANWAPDRAAALASQGH